MVFYRDVETLAAPQRMSPYPSPNASPKSYVYGSEVEFRSDSWKC